MSNSPLVTCTKLSPNNSGIRLYKISRITPHCYVGQVTAQQGINLDKFQNYHPSKGASCNYVIGTDGSVGLCVDENKRSWCSSSRENDQRAVTIECASDKTPPFAFNSTVYNKLIDLCVDICKRNNMDTLLWLGDKDKALAYTPKNNECILTAHRWFADTVCPGDWLYSREGELAKAVTERLQKKETTTPQQTTPKTEDKKVLYKVQVGAYKVKDNAINQKAKLVKKGYEAFITQVDGYYKVQVGAYAVKENAINMSNKLKKDGFDCFIKQC